MRVLIATVGTPGHTNPLIPMARHLSESGDEVLWATGPDMHSSLLAAGITTTQTGPPIALWFQRLGERTRGLPGDGVPGLRKPHWFVPRLFCEVGATAMVDDLLATAREFKPDVVLYDSRCYAAPVVARAVGAAQVLRTVTTLVPLEVEQLANDAISPLWGELQVGSPTLAGMFDGLVLSEWPASLDDPAPYGDLTVHRVAPVPANREGPDWLPRWLAEQDGRPIVYATMGTASSAAGPFNLLLEAFDDCPLAVILTLGNVLDRGALRAVPDNVRVEQYVPQGTLLPYCTAVVSHGGSGSTLGALGHGLPHVVLPQAADQFINAALTNRARVGRGLISKHTTAADLRAALGEVLGDPDYTAAAVTISAEMSNGLSLERTAALIRGTTR